MPPQGAAYNVDWVLSSTSNVHVAADRAWFTCYIPFRTKVATMPGAEPTMDIHGIGTVVLQTRVHLEGAPNKPSGEITLHHVLHAPRSTVNIFAAGLEKDLNISVRFGSHDPNPITKPGTNTVVGYLVHTRLLRLWLKDQSQDQSSLDPQTEHYIHASWPRSEIAKFNDHIAELKRHHADKLDDAPPLTKDEKDYLKKHYGGEFRFLRMYELSIYKEEDREEGRRILRAFMSESEDEAEYSDDDQESVESDEFLADMEDDPTSHVADYKFTSDQLDFLKAYYTHSGNFMRCYGLKPSEDDDCDEAVSIVKAIMDDEE